VPVSQAGQINLAVYDVLGKLVYQTIVETTDLGSTVVKWDGKNNSGNLVPNGQYHLKITNGNQLFSGKAIINR
jgi:flagellar hook assembly protein FlgD